LFRNIVERKGDNFVSSRATQIEFLVKISHLGDFIGNYVFEFARNLEIFPCEEQHEDRAEPTSK